MRGWQMLDRWADRRSAVDVWAYTHCEAVVQYATRVHGEESTR
jgi:hypothetical protein